MGTALRAAVIGAGSIAPNHLEAYRRTAGVEVVAVVDVDVERARSRAAAYDVPHALSRVDDALALGVDLVSVCTPHPVHEEVVLAAAAAGVHVLCEKPVAVDLVAGVRMVEACREAGVRLGGVFQRRFWPAAQRLRRAVDDGTLGTPVMAQVTALMHRSTEYYTADPWRGSWASDGGGVLMTQAVHQLDLLRWLLGPVETVQGTVATYRHGDHIEVEDSAAAVLTFTGGAMATVLATTAAEPNLGIELTVTGSTGATVGLRELPEGAEAVTHLWAVDGHAEERLRTSDGRLPEVDLPSINARLVPFHALQVEDFVAAVRDGREPSVTGDDALAALALVLAVYASARDGGPVRPADLVEAARPAGVAR